MTVTLGQLELWMKSEEDEHLEFKEAKENFDIEKLKKYCVALANEKGGYLILGVTARIPRKVVGTRTFLDIEKIKKTILDALRFRIEVYSINHPDGRILVLEIPPRQKGMPIQYEGAYWMRSGESVVPMTPDVLKRIFTEDQPDFSAEICSKATLRDLQPEAIEQFRQAWRRRSNTEAYDNLKNEQLLHAAELLVDGGVTYAALILLGTQEALGKYLAQAEVIFEYRSTESSSAYQQREKYREGFFLYYNNLWETINLRNDKYQYQDGLFARVIPTFNEVVIREAILNAVSHREYRSGDSVFIRQFPTKIRIESPGGFPLGINPENILWNQSWRNRRIAEVFEKCGLVERSGQGIDRIFEACIREGKPLPEFFGTDEYHVWLTIHGEVKELQFLHFLEKIGKETNTSFSTDDLLVLDMVHLEKAVPVFLMDRFKKLQEIGIIEKVGRKWILSRRYYIFVGKKGVYTRKRGLDRETNKELLLKHIQNNKETGTHLKELMEVLPMLKRGQVQTLLRELKRADKIHNIGLTKGSLWYPGSKE